MSTHPEKRKLATVMFTDIVVLSCYPTGDPLRGDARFDKIVASFAPK